MKEKTVFISYSHDSVAHRERVLALSERLRKDGIETLLDQYVNGSPQKGWPRWMLDQLDAAGSVLVICTETYHRRFRGHEEPGKGKGVDWEGALITQEMYASRSGTLKFVPVFLSAAVEDWIPEPFRSVSHYALISEGDYQRLYDFLPAVSSDLFLNEALTFFGDPAMAKSSAGAFDKGRRVAQLAGERRALVILDGLEPLQYAPTSPTPGELKDQGLAAVLKGLAATNHGLCVVTTRYSVPDLRAYWQTTAPEEKLLRLSPEAGVELLRTLGVNGNQQQFETLVADVKGHALTLNLVGTFLRDAHAGDIRRRDLVKLEEADAEEQGGHAFHVMDAYVQSLETGGKIALALLRLLGLFDRPATADCLEALGKPPPSRA